MIVLKKYNSREQHLPAECLESNSGSSRFRTWRVSDAQPTRVPRASAVVAWTRACGAARTRTTSKGLKSGLLGSMLLRFSISWKSSGYAQASCIHCNTYCNARVKLAKLRGCSSTCSQMHTSMNLTSSSTLAKTIAQRTTSVTRSTCPRYERYN